MAIAQTSMLAVCIGLLIYLAIIATSSIATQQQQIIKTQGELDAKLQRVMSNSADYVHKSDISRSSNMISLNGITLEKGEVLFLFDSTPYASKGHIGLNVPCDKERPEDPLIRILVGRAPDLAPLPLAYISSISTPPNSCIYHMQFGFGDPVTDLILKNSSPNTLTFRGTHSIVITTHESYLPTTPGLKEKQHEEITQVKAP